VLLSSRDTSTGSSQLHSVNPLYRSRHLMNNDKFIQYLTDKYLLNGLAHLCYYEVGTLTFDGWTVHLV